MNEREIPVGGDFNRIFDHQDYLAMINIPDEATCVLRAHLILEEVLNVWGSKITGTEDLYAGTFVPFKTKLVIARNLGLDGGLFKLLDKINEVRNRFSHRKGYELEGSLIDSLKDHVNNMVAGAQVSPCESLHAFVSGKNAEGERVEKKYTWEDSDNRIKFVIIFVAAILKITGWIQAEFNRRNIQFTLISTFDC